MERKKGETKLYVSFHYISTIADADVEVNRLVLWCFHRCPYPYRSHSPLPFLLIFLLLDSQLKCMDVEKGNGRRQIHAHTHPNPNTQSAWIYFCLPACFLSSAASTAVFLPHPFQPNGKHPTNISRHIASTSERRKRERGRQRERERSPIH